MAGRPPKHHRAYPNRLRAVREAKGMTLADVAKAMRMRPGTVGKYETGGLQLKVPQLEAFARALEVPPQRLLASVDPTEDEREVALLGVYRRLGPGEREQLLKIALALLPSRAAL